MCDCKCPPLNFDIGHLPSPWSKILKQTPDNNIQYTPVCVRTVHKPGNIDLEIMFIPKVHSHSVDPRKLCVGVKYYIVHSVQYAILHFGSTANLLFLGPTALIYISKERRCNEDQHGVGNFKIERVIK